jgi:hypothetical protein
MSDEVSEQPVRPSQRNIVNGAALMAPEILGLLYGVSLRPM